MTTSSKLFDYVADIFNHMIDPKNEYCKQMDEELVQTLHTELHRSRNTNPG